jgi:glycosyltransferase involved in cell wall biosynthesis
LALLFSKKKIVYHPHGVSFDPNRVRGAKCYVLKLIEAFLSLFCNKIIAISEYEMSCLRGIVSKRKLVLATNGVKDIPVTYNLPRKEKLLFIGRHDTQKGLSFLIDYYKSYETDFELHIVGESGISKEFIKEEIPNIKYLGWLEYTKVAETLASYKAVVIPSLWEGFGLVAIEALRSGTPILTSDRGALPYIVNKGDRIGAIFDLESFNTSYPKALNELKSIYDSYIHSRCYETFLNNFTASQMCLDVYEQYEL